MQKFKLVIVIVVLMVVGIVGAGCTAPLVDFNRTTNNIVEPTATADNILYNPSFEGSLAPWQVEDFRDLAQVTLDATAQYHQTWSLKAERKFESDYNDYDVQVFQTTGVTAGKQYALTFYAKSDTANLPITVELRKNGAPYTGYGLWKIINLTTTWQKYEVVFTANTTDASARFAFDLGKKKGITWLDLVKITPSDATPPPPPVVDELLRNGSFELGSYYEWLVYFKNVNSGIATLGTGCALNTYCVKLTSAAVDQYWTAQMYQVGITIKKNAYYWLSFYVKGDATARLTIEISKYGEPWTNYGFWKQITRLPSGWTKLTYHFASTATDTDTNARINFGVGDGTGVVYIDGISLKEDVPIYERDKLVP